MYTLAVFKRSTYKAVFIFKIGFTFRNCQIALEGRSNHIWHTHNKLLSGFYLCLCKLWIPNVLRETQATVGSFVTYMFSLLIHIPRDGIYFFKVIQTIQTLHWRPLNCKWDNPSFVFLNYESCIFDRDTMAGYDFMCSNTPKSVNKAQPIKYLPYQLFSFSGIDNLCHCV